jgi:hypothetical protein
MCSKGIEKFRMRFMSERNKHYIKNVLFMNLYNKHDTLND